MKIVGIGLLAAALLVGAAIKFLPWWGGIAVVVGLAIVGKLAARRLLTGFVMKAFRAKGAVLAGARATVNAITPAGPPKPNEDDDPEDFEEMLSELEEDGPRHWVHVDVSIQVDEAGPDTPFSMWDPSELTLVKLDTVEGEMPDDEDDVASVHGAEVHHDGAWVTCEESLAGSQRVRLLVAAIPGVDQFKIRYYFEVLTNAGRR